FFPVSWRVLGWGTRWLHHRESGDGGPCIFSLCWGWLLHFLAGRSFFFVLPVVGDLMRPVWQMLWNYQPMLLGLRFVVSFLILLVPTTAMGLTLPVIIEDPLLRETEFGR